MPERQFELDNGYRYGFNGKENDNEVKGEGNQQDYGMRIYDTRLGRFLSVDPLTNKYPFLTPYQFASSTPIMAIDLDGQEKLEAFFLLSKGNNGEVVTNGSTAVQIVFDVEKNTISALYGTVGGKVLKFEYNIDSKAITVSQGNISLADVVKKYGQVGTKIPKGTVNLMKSWYEVLGAFGYKHDKLESTLDNFDKELWKTLKKQELTSLFIGSRNLINEFFNSNLPLQVTEDGESDIYRVFDNKVKDLSAIEEGLNLKLSLLQVSIPKEEAKKEKTKEKPVSPKLKKREEQRKKNWEKNMKNNKGPNS